MRRSRGFSLLEVLLAISLVGTGVVSLLVVQSNSVDRASLTVRLASTRLLVGEHAGHWLAYDLNANGPLPADDWQQRFPEYHVEHKIEDVALDDLLPDEARMVAMSPVEGPNGEAAPASAETEEAGPAVVLRKLELTVAPPGWDDDPGLAIKIVTFKMVSAEAATQAAGQPAQPGAESTKFPRYDPPIVGPDAELPNSQADPNADPAAGEPGANPPGGNPPGGG